MALRDDVKKQKTKEVREKRVDRQEIKKATTVKRDPPFLTLRVWVNFILSSLQKDRGRIPDNIGSKMLISNNMYITRYYMNSIVQVSSLSIDTPVTFSSELLRYVRGKESDAVIDFTFKNERLDINLKESGWQTRIDTWQKIIDATVDPKNEWGVSEKDKIMAVRCMYTIQKVKEGHKLYKTRMYITIRSKTGSALTRAEKLVFEYLNKVGAEYHVLVGDVKQQLEYISLLSNCKNDVHIDFVNYKIGDPEIEGLGDAASTVVLFLDGIASVHSKLCAYTQIVRYTCNCPVDLGRINYLGIEEDSLKTNIMKMERERMLPLVESVIKAIEDRLNSISYCLEKRIIMLLVVTYELGLYEITATIAELLHISMVG